MMKKLFSKRVAALFTALLLISQLCIIDFRTFAQNTEINNPPTTYPENCVKKLDVDIDVTGDFSSGNTVKTINSFATTNLTKYLTFEFDMYIVSTQEESQERVYFMDSTYKRANEGRGFRNVKVKTNEWVHVSIDNTLWDTGWGMNGDITDACGMKVESFTTADTRIVIKNVCVTADDIVSPDAYPEKVIAKAKNPVVNTFLTITTPEKDLTAEFPAIDITYGDFVEMDYYVGTPIGDTLSPLSVVFKDENSKRAVYKFDRTPNNWQHLKITLADLDMQEGFEPTKITSYVIENANIGERLYFDNLCVTGIAWPLEYPEGTAKEMGGKFDITDTTGGKTTITPYGETYDFTSHDFFEFDVYIESENNSVNFNFFLYDGTWNGSSNTPSSAQRKMYKYQSIETNKWVHIRTNVSDIVSSTGTGNLSDVKGFFLSGLSKNNRYIIVNQCISDLQITEVNNKYSPITKFDKDIDYKGTNTATDKVVLENEVDLTAGTYLEFDSSVVSTSANVEAKLVLEDAQGNKASKTISITANVWKHNQIKLTEFEGISGIGAVTALYLENLTNSSRSCVYNLFLTKIIVPEMQNKYTVKEELFDNWIWNGDEGVSYYFNDEHTPIDLTAHEFLEFDVLYETETEVANPTFRMFFKDVSGKGGFYDFSMSKATARGNGWYHFRINTSDFDTGWGFNGDPTKAVRFALHSPRTDNTTFHIVNGFFTYLKKPELKTRYDVVLDTGISGAWSSIKGANCLKSRSYINEDKSTVDITQGTHIELDVYLESAADTRKLTMYFVDETFKGAAEGRGTWQVDFKNGEWVHIILPIDTVQTGYGMNGDLTKTNSFMFESTETGSEADTYMVHNLVITKRYTVPSDSETKPATPDKESTYISDGEELMNDLGIWNTNGASKNSLYKTEGTSSIRLKVANGDDSKNSLRFLFNDPCDFTQSQSVRFDLFIDDILLAKGHNYKVIFTSDRRFKGDSFEYLLSTENLVVGWNSIEISLKDFKAQDDADWSSIYGFGVGPVEVNMEESDYYYMGIDNLRVYKTFTVLVAPEEEDEEEGKLIPEDENMNYGNNDFFFENMDTTIGETVEQENTNTQVNGGIVKKYIRRRKVNSGMSTDLIVLITVSAVGGVLLLTAITLSALTERKYRKLLKKQQTL